MRASTNSAEPTLTTTRRASNSGLRALEVVCLAGFMVDSGLYVGSAPSHKYTYGFAAAAALSDEPPARETPP